MHIYEVKIILKGNRKIIETIKATTANNARKAIESRYPNANVYTPKRIS